MEHMHATKSSRAQVRPGGHRQLENKMETGTDRQLGLNLGERASARHTPALTRDTALAATAGLLRSVSAPNYRDTTARHRRRSDVTAVRVCHPSHLKTPALAAHGGLF